MFLNRWAPAAAWGALVLWASTDVASGERTAVMLQSVLAWLHLGSGAHHDHFGNVNFFARKSAHVFEFFIFALLVWRAVGLAPALKPRPLRIVFWALGSATALALLSEGIQLFFPTRTPQFSDVLLDIGGALAGILFALAFQAIPKPARAPAEMLGTGQP